MTLEERSLFAGSESHRQGAANVRLDWGPEGLDAIGSDADVIVIVDVLSFTTCVDVAVARGAIVFPFVFAWGATTSTGRPDRSEPTADEETAEDYASRMNALVANKGRHRTDAHPWTLSPSNLSEIPTGTRLVLPSPNGSALSFAASESAASTTVLAGCLRNATAVAGAAVGAGRRISIIAGGERWRLEGRPMRVSLEDHLGAGAIASALQRQSPDLELSPEAIGAARLFDAVKPDLREVIHGCVSGVELTERGFDGDVDLASQLDASNTVPVLVDRSYRPLTS